MVNRHSQWSTTTRKTVKYNNTLRKPLPCNKATNENHCLAAKQRHVARTIALQ
jgi:hypothetical protein